MKNKIILIILIFIIFILSICEIGLYVEMKFKNNSPKIEAASAFYPFAVNLVQKIYDEDSYSSEVLQMVSTSQAFSDIIDGKTDIIIATEPSDEQKELIKNSSISLEYKKLYLEPLIIFSNKENSVKNLNIEQI